MPYDGPSVHDMARGQWRGILLRLGVPDNHLTGRHGSCPFCGGRDRFRFDNKDGSGSYICGQCGAGSGMDFVMKLKGWDFATAAREVEALLHGHSLPKDEIKPKVTPEDTRRMAWEIWQKSEEIKPGSQADGYLRARGVGMDDYSENLRFVPMLRYSATLSLPAIVAKIVDADGKGASLHRTFIDGHRKADVPNPRMMLPGSLPDGACVRLSGPREEICIAEGIETALACERLFETPCWAVLNTSMMEKWILPSFVRSVTICADNDPKFGGQKAAYTLAHRLLVGSSEIEVKVRVPDDRGTDWLDVWNKEKQS